MARHQLIDRHLAVLAEQLPGPVIDELTDGLVESWERMLAAGVSADEAATAAIRDFGDPSQIVEAFVAQAPGRRMARLLLYTAPLVAACWAVSLVTARAWTWPIPLPVATAFGVVLTASAVALVTSAASQRSYRRTRLGIAGGVGAILLDTGMLTIVVLTAPAFVWPMAAAIPASITRFAATLRSLLRGHAL